MEKSLKLYDKICMYVVSFLDQYINFKMHHYKRKWLQRRKGIVNIVPQHGRKKRAIVDIGKKANTDGRISSKKHIKPSVLMVKGKRKRKWNIWHQKWSVDVCVIISGAKHLIYWWIFWYLKSHTDGEFDHNLWYFFVGKPTISAGNRWFL